MHEHTAALYRTAQAIADALGWGWTVIQPPEEELQRWVDLQRDDDPQCGVRLMRDYQDKGRFRLAGRFPSHNGYSGLGYQEKRAEITVRADRNAAQIARDILRRLLPTYMVQYPRAAAAVATAQAHDAATAETNALAREQVRAYDLRTRGLAHGPSVHVESVHGTEVTLKLYNLPRQKLQALLTLLTEAQD